VDTFQALSPDSRPIFVTSLGNERGSRAYSEFVRNEDELQQFISRYDHPGRALYRTVGTLRMPEDGRLVDVPSGHRCKDTVESTAWIYGDIDFKHHPDIPPETIRQRIAGMAPEPTMVIFSGHGLHVYWRIERVDAAPGEAQRRVEEVLRLACGHVGGDPQVAETARLLRLPGSHNSREPGEHILTEIVHHDPEVVYTLEGLSDALLAATPVMPAAAPTKPAVNGHDRELGWSGPLLGDGALEAMRFQDRDAPINQTTLRLAAKWLGEGRAVDEIVASLLAAVKAAAAKDENLTKNWNWATQEWEIRDQCYRWINKRMKEEGRDLSHLLNDRLYSAWRRAVVEGKRPAICVVPGNPTQYQIRGYHAHLPRQHDRGADLSRGGVPDPGRADGPGGGPGGGPKGVLRAIPRDPARRHPPNRGATKGQPPQGVRPLRRSSPANPSRRS
jgi:hypothetical protein